jgi:hypothetical protein
MNTSQTLAQMQQLRLMAINRNWNFPSVINSKGMSW